MGRGDEKALQSRQQRPHCSTGQTALAPWRQRPSSSATPTGRRSPTSISRRSRVVARRRTSSPATRPGASPPTSLPPPIKIGLNDFSTVLRSNWRLPHLGREVGGNRVRCGFKRIGRDVGIVGLLHYRCESQSVLELWHSWSSWAEHRKIKIGTEMELSERLKLHGL
jgi:hypothetical protein